MGPADGTTTTSFLLYQLALEWACRYTKRIERVRTELEEQVTELTQHQHHCVERQQAAEDECRHHKQACAASRSEVEAMRGEMEALQTARVAWDQTLKEKTAAAVADMQLHQAEMQRCRSQLEQTERRVKELEQEVEQTQATGEQAQREAALELETSNARCRELETSVSECRRNVVQFQEQAEAETQRANELHELLETAQRKAEHDRKLVHQRQLVHESELKRVTQASEKKAAAVAEAHDATTSKLKKMLQKEKEDAKRLDRQLGELRTSSETALEQERKAAQEAQLQLKIQADAHSTEILSREHDLQMARTSAKGAEDETERVKADLKTEKEAVTALGKTATEHKQCAMRHRAELKRATDAAAATLKQTLERKDVEHRSAHHHLQQQLMAAKRDARESKTRYTALVAQHDEMTASGGTVPLTDLPEGDY